jgi:hypothetical protein
MRKIGPSAKAKSRLARKAPNRKTTKHKTTKHRKSVPAKKSALFRKKAAAEPYPPGVRPPPPRRDKRGEKGYLGHLLRQAQAAARLTLERALADLGVTPPQFAVLAMLRAYPGLSGGRSGPRGAADPADRRRHHPQPGARWRDPEGTASGTRPGAAVDPDPPRQEPARQMPASRHGAGEAAGGRAWRQGTGNGAALAGQNCRRAAVGWLVPLGRCVLPRPSLAAAG